MKSEEIRFAINFEYNEHNLSVKEFDLMLQNFAMTYHKEQLLQTDVSSSNYIDESPEPRINIHRFNDNEYDKDGRFLR